jgi:non-ribosomal peptide synthetase component F
MPATLARKLMAPNRRVWNWYGPTECSILSTSFLCEDQNISERVDVPIGKPLPNYIAYQKKKKSPQKKPKTKKESHIFKISRT